jgi:hypothetical protein
MGPLRIRIKKQTDGSAALSCTRADGSVTWQRQLGVQGRFFPLHDLTHYAVETVLGHRSGFFGLVASGWDVTDFGAPWPKGHIPPDADPSELIVGLLDAERASGTLWTAEELNEKIGAHCAEQGGALPPAMTDGQLAAVRLRRSELFAQWKAVPPGDALELEFVVA